MRVLISGIYIYIETESYRRNQAYNIMTPPTKLKYCDAMEQILENSQHVSESDMRMKVSVVTEAAETEDNWVFVSKQLSQALVL